MAKKKYELEELNSKESVDDIRKYLRSIDDFNALNSDEQTKYFLELLRKLVELRFYFVFIKIDDTVDNKGNIYIEPIYYESEPDEKGKRSKAIPLFFTKDLPESHVADSDGLLVADKIDFSTFVYNVGKADLHDIEAVLIDPIETNCIIPMKFIKIFAQSLVEFNNEESKK